MEKSFHNGDDKKIYDKGGIRRYMTETRTIDFEIIKEPWNIYQLADNSILKTRTILKKAERVIDGKKMSFSVDAQTLTVIYAVSSLKGERNPNPVTNEQIRNSIELKDMNYSTIAQEFNEYRLDDGTKIKIFTNIAEISRTTLKDAKGDPIYTVSSNNSMEIKPSQQYRQ